MRVIPRSGRDTQGFVVAFYSPKDTALWRAERLFNDMEGTEVFCLPDGRRYKRAVNGANVDAVVFFTSPRMAGTEPLQLKQLT